MSIVFACIPELLKPKLKQEHPEITFFKVDDMDASQHPKPRKKREKKIPVEVNNVGCLSTL